VTTSPLTTAEILAYGFRRKRNERKNVYAPRRATAELEATRVNGDMRRIGAGVLAVSLLPLAFAQWGRGGGDPRGYGGGGYGGGGYGGGGYGGSYGGQQPAANAVARPGGDSSLDDSVRLFLQLDQDGTSARCALSVRRESPAARTRSSLL